MGANDLIQPMKLLLFCMTLLLLVFCEALGKHGKHHHKHKHRHHRRRRHNTNNNANQSINNHKQNKRNPAQFSEHLASPLKGHLSGKTCDKILSLVSIAENGDINWWKHYNYIQNLGDDRGYTISIVGFCTGTGDFIQVLQELQHIHSGHPLVKFIPQVQGKSGGDVSGLEGLPDAVTAMGNQDQHFNTAAWKVINKLYWNPSVEYCNKNGFHSALCVYILYDTMINFGDLGYFKDVSGGNEKDFLASFLDVKQKGIESGNLGDTTNNRVDMQKKLLADGNMNLSGDLKVNCYQTDYVVPA